MKRILCILATLFVTACDDQEDFRASGRVDSSRILPGYVYDTHEDEVITETEYSLRYQPNYEEDWAKLVVDEKELRCLAWNIYFEAEGEPTAGQIAVAHVTMNRTNDPKYPATICENVFKPFAFSWTHDGSIAKRKINKANWKKAVEIAEKVAYGVIRDNTRGATHFYNPETAAKKRWMKHEYDIVQIDNHKFVKLKNGI